MFGDAGGVAPQDVTLCLAGALGEHVIHEDLLGLGFAPSNMASKLRAVGNSSLKGAALLLRKPELRTWLAKAPDWTQVLDLTAAPDFTQAFVQGMVFTYVA